MAKRALAAEVEDAATAAATARQGESGALKILPPSEERGEYEQGRDDGDHELEENRGKEAQIQAWDR